MEKVKGDEGAMNLKWLKTYSSKSTVRAYKWGLEQFLNLIVP
jgi:hypothetical protein